MLRNSDDAQNLRGHLIATAARLIAERGTAGLAVRDIARQAQVADGALYNYFEDKEDLLAHALLAHVGDVMADAPHMPPAGTNTVAENLELFIERGLGILARIVPAFAGLIAQPKVLARFHAMVGGDAAFDPAIQGDDRVEPAHEDVMPRGLPQIITRYLRAEQELGRVAATADIDAAATLIVGTMHGHVLPRMLFNPPGTTPGTPPGTPPDLAARLTTTILDGIAPK